ncbi:MAG: MgtC/SapB family protein [Tissierellia bacterium]|nr:MgtC/SapB family protein [Tissierellia bacterium]
MFVQPYVILRLVFAAFLGGLIGLERESNNQAAGLRTHILVSTGSALIMLTSIFLAEQYNNHDHARIAAQVVSGIGFLGAGTIMIRGFDIKGLTTAASLWVDAGIGLAVGAGFYLPAITTVIIVILALFLLQKVEFKIIEKVNRELIVYTYNEKKTFENLGQLLAHYGAKVHEIHIESEERDDRQIRVLKYEIFFPIGFHPAQFLTDLEKTEALEKVKYDGRIVINREIEYK